MATEKQRRAFISYSRTNKEFATKLTKGLRSAGYPVWFDLMDIPTGSRWDDEVEKALRECNIFMVILTPASIASENVKDEIGYAIDHGKRILPVYLEDCDVPLRLRRFQYVDFTTKSFEEGFESAKELLGDLVDEASVPLATQAASLETQIEPKAKVVPESKVKEKTNLATNAVQYPRWIAGLWIALGLSATMTIGELIRISTNSFGLLFFVIFAIGGALSGFLIAIVLRNEYMVSDKNTIIWMSISGAIGFTLIEPSAVTLLNSFLFWSEWGTREYYLVFSIFSIIGGGAYGFGLANTLRQEKIFSDRKTIPLIAVFGAIGLLIAFFVEPMLERSFGVTDISVMLYLARFVAYGIGGAVFSFATLWQLRKERNR